MTQLKLIDLAERMLGQNGKLPENIRRILTRMEAGKATWEDAQTLAGWAGYCTGLDLADQLSKLGLEGAEFTAQMGLLVPAALTTNYELVSTAAQSVQQGLNRQARIGLKVQRAALNRDRVDGLVTELSGKAEQLEDWGGTLAQQVENFSRSIVDDTIKANAQSHFRAGLQPAIVRRSSGGCCPWCDALAGRYRYPDEVPDDLYRRHTNCDCVVEYLPGDGKAQNVWTKQVYRADGGAERRKALDVMLTAQRRSRAGR